MQKSSQNSNNSEKQKAINQLNYKCAGIYKSISHRANERVTLSPLPNKIIFIMHMGFILFDNILTLQLLENKKPESEAMQYMRATIYQYKNASDHDLLALNEPFEAFQAVATFVGTAEAMQLVVWVNEFWQQLQIEMQMQAQMQAQMQMQMYMPAPGFVPYPTSGYVQDFNGNWYLPPTQPPLYPQMPMQQAPAVEEQSVEEQSVEEQASEVKVDVLPPAQDAQKPAEEVQKPAEEPDAVIDAALQAEIEERIKNELLQKKIADEARRAKQEFSNKLQKAINSMSFIESKQLIADSDDNRMLLINLLGGFNVTKNNKEKYREFICKLNLSLEDLNHLQRNCNKDVKRIAQSIYQQIKNEQSVLKKASVEAEKKQEEQKEKQVNSHMVPVGPAKQQKSAVATEQIQNISYRDIIITQNHVEFNALRADKNKKEKFKNTYGYLSELLETGNGSLVTEAFLKAIDLPLDKLFSLSEITKMTGKQQFVILSRILNLLLAGTDMKLIESKYAYLEQRISKLKQILNEEDYATLQALIKALSESMLDWFDRKCTEEFEYLEKLSPNAEIDFARLPFTLQNKARNFAGETLLMIAIRKKLSEQSIEMLSDEKYIDDRLFMSVTKEHNRHVLDYWARYLHADNIIIVYKLIDRFVKISTPSRAKINPLKKKTPETEMEDEDAVLKELSAAKMRDNEGNTFLHTLISCNLDLELMIYALNILSQSKHKDLILPAGLLQNMKGFTAYSLLEAKCIYLYNDKNVADKLHKKLLGLLVATALQTIEKLKIEHMDIYFPPAQNFFNPPELTTLKSMLCEHEIELLLYAIERRYAVKEDLATYRKNVYGGIFLGGTVLQKNKTNMLKAYFNADDLLTLFEGTELYVWIIDIVIARNYPEYAEDLLGEEAGKAIKEFLTLEKNAARFENELQMCLEMEAFQYCEIKKIVDYDSKTAIDTSTILDVDRTIHWKLLLIYLVKISQGLEDVEMPPETINYFMMNCTMNPNSACKNALNYAIHLNNLPAVEFMLEICHADISAHTLAHAKTAKLAHPRYKIDVLKYLLVNYTKKEKIEVNPIQFLLYLIAEQIIDFAEMQEILEEILVDPVMNKRLLNDNNFAKLNTETNETSVESNPSLLSTIFSVAKNKALSRTELTELFAIYLEKGFILIPETKSDLNPLFMSLAFNSISLLKLFLEHIAPEKLPQLLKQKLKSHDGVYSNILEISYDFANVIPAASKEKPEAEQICILLENEYKKYCPELLTPRAHRLTMQQ